MTFEEYRTQIAAYDCATYFEKYPEIDTTLEHLGRQFDQMEPAVRAHMLDSLEVAVENVPDWMKIHFLSFCMAQKRDPHITEKLLDTVLAADYSEVGEYNKLSHYWQITRAVFTDGTLKSSEVERKLTGLYHTLFEAFSTAVGVTKRCYIPRKERNQNLVIVFSPQVLGLGHAPTKTLLDRSYVLKTFLHKEVMIVNTAMYMTKKGRAPFYHMQEAEYAAELSELSSLEFKGETFSHMQCPEDMPDLQVIASLVQLIRDRRPDYIIGIGGNDICADICGRIVPQITVSTVFSGIATSCGEWQMVGKRTLSETDEMRLQELGVQKECVKCVPFTFSFKPQQDHYTRADLTLPEEKFLVATVGWRLDDEVTGAYLKMLEEAVGEEPAIHVVFVGRFHRFGEALAGYPVLQAHATNLGEQQDVLAVLECMDLYVNPARSGGGSSAAEALSKGLPVVTLPVGDVAVAAGEIFEVEDYPAMRRQILRYAADHRLYAEMTQKARARAELLLRRILIRFRLFLDLRLQRLLLDCNLFLLQLDLTLLLCNIRVGGCHLDRLTLLLFLDLVSRIGHSLLRVRLHLKFGLLDGKLILLLRDLRLRRNRCIIGLFVRRCLCNLNVPLTLGTGNRRTLLDLYNVVNTQIFNDLIAVHEILDIKADDVESHRRKIRLRIFLDQVGKLLAVGYHLLELHLTDDLTHITLENLSCHPGNILGVFI